MSDTSAQQLNFWRIVARELGVGTRLLDALEQARTQITGTDLEPAARAIIADVQAGQTLSNAMAEHAGVFSRAQQAMVRAGEVGGVLDVCVRRMVDGLVEGALLPQAESLPLHEQLALYWWAFGCMLSSGVPMLDAIEVAGEGVSDTKLREAITAIRQSVGGGRPMSQAMGRFAELFPKDICDAVAVAEERGELDVAAMRIADALKKGTGTPRLPSESAPAAVTCTCECIAPGDSAAEQARKIVNLILLQSVNDKAADLHLDPLPEGGGRLRYRIDGVLYEMMPPPPPLFPMLVNRLKIMAGLDVAETRQPQHGRIMLSINNDPIDLRVSVLPTFNGERLVVRFLRKEALVDLKCICGEDEQKLTTLRSLCQLSRGVVLCDGPTGSGKTTLLYAMISEIDRTQKCVITIEDPVEFTLPGVAQVQVRPQAGLTFTNAMRHVLRQDPDVVVVGEIRDLEALQVAVMVANTGHLVLTSMHAGSAPGTLKRLLDVGLEPFLVNSSVAAVVSQLLVRRLCPKCKQKVQPALHSLPPEAVELVRRAEGATFYQAKGCPECHDTGHAGRLAIHEILVMNDAVRQAISSGAPLGAMRQAAVNRGMRTLLMDGMKLAAAGQTSIEEVMRVVPLTGNE